MSTPAGAITLSDGTWVLMEEMHGRDYREVLSIDQSDPASINTVFTIIEKRCIDASVPDVLDLSISLLMELAGKWMGGIEDEALPPVNAPGSAQPSQPRRSTKKGAPTPSPSPTRSTNSASAGASTPSGSTS